MAYPYVTSTWYIYIQDIVKNMFLNNYEEDQDMNIILTNIINQNDFRL